MSNWFDDEKKETPGASVPEPGEPLITPPPADSASAGDSGSGPEKQPEESPSSAIPDGGWQRSDTTDYRYAPPAPNPPQPPQPPAQPSYGGWNSAPYTAPSSGQPGNGASSSQPSPDSYFPQGNYASYGAWNAPPAPDPSGKPPKKKRNKSNAVIAILAVVCGAAIITLSVLLALSMNGNSGGLPAGSTPGSTSSANQGDPNAPTLDIQENDGDNDGGLTSKQIIQKNLDSVVVLTMYQNVQTGGFFGRDEGTSAMQAVGGASGIVMTADGYIITNWHCVVNEDTLQPYAKVEVTTYDGTEYEAQVIGADQDTDLAVIKVNAANLQPAEFGDSSKLVMGDRVIALGNAGGLEWSASQGIISGLARDVYEDTGYSIKCLQTDAAINPGNSGGPLLNNQGQVIAVNSAKIGGEDYEGLGFSIPINEAKVIIDDLAKYGYVKGRVMLGITGSQVDQPGYEGFLIRSIEEGSCLAGTKAQAGDIITHVNGVRVETYAAMRSELTKYKVGETITLTLMRVDQRQNVSFDVQCTLGESQG